MTIREIRFNAPHDDVQSIVVDLETYFMEERGDTNMWIRDKLYIVTMCQQNMFSMRRNHVPTLTPFNYVWAKCREKEVWKHMLAKNLLLKRISLILIDD